MKTILVVDDNKLNLASARRVLQDQYKVIPVTKGQQALTYLESGECDIILLDINMPDMDGFEVLERIREMKRCSNIPVIFLTADNDAETEARCFTMGAVDFVTKPFVPEVMLSRIGRVLEVEELRRSLTDRLEQKTKEVSAIKAKSRQDALTGLWNRLYTEEMVDGLLKAGSGGSMMMIDLDNFKAINDNYGHIAGDRTLKMFADILRENAAPEDVICRIGGDEFVLYIRGITSKDALSDRAVDIIAAMNCKLEENKFETNSSVSIGIARAPEDGKDFLELYSSADKALYYVKQNGKNSYHFFSDKLQSAISAGRRTVDLKYLQDLMSRGDNGKGAYLLNFQNFNHVYNFIRRFVDRSKTDVQTVLFTVSESGSSGLETAETEEALELLEKAIYNSLRRSDVTTRYSSKQLIVILMEADSFGADVVAKRILDNFEKINPNKRIRIDYGIARMNNPKV